MCVWSVGGIMHMVVCVCAYSVYIVCTVHGIQSICSVCSDIQSVCSDIESVHSVYGARYAQHVCGTY